MNKFKVVLTDNALLDLGDIYMYIAQNDSKERAEYVFNNILLVAESLADNPERGNRPKELLRVGVTQFREIFFKVYRIFYTTDSKSVTIHLITDGRRDMPELLHHRLVNL